MPLLETKGAASAQGFGLTLSTTVANYIEEVFSTYLYTGTGATLSINNGIDLSTKGGQVWIKQRSGTQDHTIFDTARGVNNYLRSNSTGAQNPGGTYSDLLTAFNTTGFSLGADASTAGFVNGSGSTYVSWTFREQPKFFDVVTYTGNGVSGRTVAHNLGSVPGCMIIKRLDSTSNWPTYHRSLSSPQNNAVLLNLTNAALGAGFWTANPTDTVFSLSSDADVNVNGGSYVAYLFAHDAGGFGLTGTDNVISCGSYVGSGVASPPKVVTLGYEPQWIMIKSTTNAYDWVITDTMRGMSQTSGTYLVPNTSAAEVVQNPTATPTATGFELNNSHPYFNSNDTYIYIAIRRGPMKVPTDSTTVFGTRVRTGDDTSAPTITPTTAMVTDMVLTMNRSGGAGGSAGAGAVGGFVDFDRLRSYKALYTISTNAEPAPGAVGYFFDRQNGVIGNGLDTGQFFNYDTNNASYSYINYFFRRAPGFFDEVCYTGTGANQTLAHNLKTIPELIIVKARSNTTNWLVKPEINTANFLYLDLTNAIAGPGTTLWSSTNQTASNFYVGTATATNASGGTFVAYLFATCPGVSKVGSYTGTGTTLQINCGFTAGSRFVMIKRTDSTGDWYVWDSARGIVAGNDPYLLFNSNAAEVTGTDYVDTFSSGFEISSTAPVGINASGGTFIFLAIA
jgi:hypothetical protein